MRADTLQQLLLRAREQPGTGVRFVDGAEQERFVSWAEIAERAAQTAGGLVARGVGPGDTVALVYPTAPEFFVAFFGVLFAGAVPVPLYPPVRLGRLDEYRRRTARMIEAARAVLLLADAKLAPMVGEALALAKPRLGWSTLEALPPGAASASAGRPDELGLVQFSSGTTVEPKPVALEQRALLAQVRVLNALWPDSAEVRQSCVSWLPLYHDMGLVGCVFPALERPAMLTLLPPERFVERPALWLRAIARHRATISVAPNFAYALASERIGDDELAGCDLSSWRVALCGAEAVSADTLRRFAARFARFGFDAQALTPVYGLSEAALAVTFSALDRPFRAQRFDRAELAGAGRGRPVDDPGQGVELVSVGTPLAGFALELRDGSGRRVADGEVGQLWVRGPSLMRDYLEQPLPTAQVLRSGWLDTGDLGLLHDGELYLTGRAKEVLIVRGANHSPVELERALDLVAGVRRGCAVAVSERTEGGDTERVLLFVERARGATAELRATLAARCRAAVLAATGLLPDEIHLLAPGTLPRTSSGKLRRGETLRLHHEGRLEAPAASGVFALLRAFWRGRRALGRAISSGGEERRG